jgi:hypothetical protein
VNAKPRAWVLALAFGLLAVLLVLRYVMAEGDEPPTVAFAPSVALFALELGVVGGGVAGVVAVALAALTQESDVTFASIFFRSSSLLVLGLLVGGLGKRLRVASSTARAASQINDDVVQSLVLAKYALGAGQVDEAQSRIDETLESARRIVEGLSPDVRPGHLRREPTNVS